MEQKTVEAPGLSGVFPPIRGNGTGWAAFVLAIILAGLSIWAFSSKSQENRAETRVSDSIEWFDTVSSIAARNQAGRTLEQLATVDGNDIAVANAMNSIDDAKKVLGGKSAQFATAVVLAGLCAAGLLSLFVLKRLRTADVGGLKPDNKIAALNTGGEEPQGTPGGTQQSG